MNDTVSTLPGLDVGTFDPWTDTITIEGVRYAGVFFREGFSGMIGQVLRIEKRQDGVVTVTRLREFEQP